MKFLFGYMLFLTSVFTLVMAYNVHQIIHDPMIIRQNQVYFNPTEIQFQKHLGFYK